MIQLATPHGARAYNEALLALHIRYGGDTWPLADAVGAASVASLRGVTPGTPSAGGLTFGAAGPFIHGQPARACAFDGAAGFVSVTPSPTSPTGAVTFCAWVSVTDPASATRQNILGFGTGASDRFSLQTISGTLRASYFNGTTYSTSADYSFGMHHVAITKQSGNYAPAIYVDGSIAASGVLAATMATANKLVLMARNDTIPTLFCAGTMLYASLFGATLSAADIRTLYTLGRAGQ